MQVITRLYSSKYESGGNLRWCTWAAVSCAFMSVLMAQPPSSTVPFRPQQLPSHLRGRLSLFGDLLTAPGKERTTINGTLTRGGAGVGGPSNVQIVAELGGRLRITDQGPAKASGSDGAHLWGEKDELTEMLLDDIMKRFFTLYASHAPARFLGTRYRFDHGRAQNYRGSYRDVFALGDTVLQKNSATLRTRYYCVNSDLDRSDHRYQSLFCVMRRFNDGYGSDAKTCEKDRSFAD